tara:strand:+ start:6900 stop:7130 length:231 start_codon:yes stop_codon:yes gene_type:complete
VERKARIGDCAQDTGGEGLPHGMKWLPAFFGGRAWNVGECAEWVMKLAFIKHYLIGLGNSLDIFLGNRLNGSRHFQ